MMSSNNCHRFVCNSYNYCSFHARYSCVDIDECANDPTLCENGHCTNTPGGYECDCDVGFTKSPDGRSCLGKCLVGRIVCMNNLIFKVKKVKFI